MSTRIVGLERRLMPIGKIRFGDQIESRNGKKRPHVLDKPRFTSSNAFILGEAAKLYGGTVRPWEDAPPGARQYELYAEVDAIPILIPPIEALHQCYECWSAKGCLRRCDNETIQHAYAIEEVGQPCSCPADPEERQTLAADGKACKLTTRISCMIPDLPGVGLWTIETHSYYASLWTAGMVELLEAMAKEGRMCEAMLKMERQSRKGRNGVRNFAIPTIMPQLMTPRQLFAPQMRAGLGLPGEDVPQLSVAQEHKALPEHSADIFGDQDALQASLAAARQGSRPTLPDDGTATLRTQIDALLTAQGLNDLQREAYWAQQQREQSPGALMYLKEKLEGEARRADAASHARQEVMQHIGDAHTQAGHAPVWIAAYWTKMRKRFRLDQDAVFTLEHLQALEQEVKEFYAKEAAKKAQEGATASTETASINKETGEIVQDDHGWPEEGTLAGEAAPSTSAVARSDDDGELF